MEGESMGWKCNDKIELSKMAVTIFASYNVLLCFTRFFIKKYLLFVFYHL